MTLSSMYCVVRDSVRHQFTPSLGVTLLSVVRKRGHVTHVSHHTVYTLGNVLTPQEVSVRPDMCDSLGLSGGPPLSTVTLTIHSKEGG